MLDPFPLAPPTFLITATKPLADALNLHTLPLHAHEILFAALLYTFVEKIFSPWLSTLLFPHLYPRLSRKARLNWDVHIVSFVQSVLICGLSLWIIWFDEERKAWREAGRWEERIWGYYGAGGLCQSFALGYFLWDIYMCSMNVDIFGWGMWAHAVSAVAVFGLGYRPFIYFSAPVFLLYELSSPFLNIHWFCDKLHLTGSIYQAINGVFLVATFFACRIVWGLYSSVWVFRDMWWAIQAGHTSFTLRVPGGKLDTFPPHQLLAISRDPIGQLQAFNNEKFTPIWIPIIYLVSNLTLNSLNLFWFGKMIETIRTRFDPPWGTKGVAPDGVHGQAPSKDEKVGAGAKPRRQSIAQLNPEGGTVEEELDLGAEAAGDAGEALAKVASNEANEESTANNTRAASTEEVSDSKKKGSVRAARARAEEAMNGPVGVVEDTKIERAGIEDGDVGVEVTGGARRSVRSRRKA